MILKRLVPVLLLTYIFAAWTYPHPLRANPAPSRIISDLQSGGINIGPASALPLRVPHAIIPANYFSSGLEDREDSCSQASDSGWLTGLISRAMTWVDSTDCPRETASVLPLQKAPATSRPIDIYENGAVRDYLRFYLKHYRGVFEWGLKRSGRYMPMIRSIFAEEGVPLELAYLPAVESNFNPRARSYARAMGLWQFMAPTARRFGLKVKYPWYDERLDPELSTRAAARFLVYLHDKYHSWELALAAYNAGEGRVNRALRNARRRGGRSDYWNLKLPPQTKEYVPAFLALTKIFNSPSLYGFSHVIIDPPRAIETIQVDFSTSLAEISHRLNIPLKKMVELNPAWRRGYIHSNFKGKALLNLPEGFKETLLSSLAREPVKPIPWLIHRVEKGETLSQIAKGYGLPMSEIISVNPISNLHFLGIGQKLVIPLSPEATSSQPWKKPGSEEGADTIAEIITPPETALHFHSVQKGESLWSIARLYGVTMGKLKSWNSGIGNSLRPEQELVIFLPGQSS